MFNLDYFSIKDKVIIVTGGNTGLGLAYAKALGNAGAKLVVSHFDANVTEIQEFCNSNNVELLLVQGNLTLKEDVDALVEKTLEKFGRIDVLINNAGTIIREPLLEYSETSWHRVIDINLNAVWFLSQKVANVMKKQGGGKIINVASMLAFQGGKFVPAYTASKHAVAGLTKAFANELASENIQVNAIAPGYIETANTAPIRADEKRNAEILSRIPAGHWGKTEELMGTIVFLASKASDYINGAIIPVDGGWLSR
ncbi:2-dehydro-3-deoxy-D-gluconate 5-dehydrogenase KduD [Mycoplasmopsis gallinacea]|uniref:2-dehydro-3-deoxy-D-gluconate 5-dehydrogenase KduD n=1 Tax=Mycoplasmopsis gallinacea TaxID=29556 RepID=A0A449A2K4_9BACT|nr:2-dehydro-3-deoxy-D-gluconate 5-dehydrogenase KduD [Mycoplasmopsis gallinacea]QIW62611.1 2-dehydro-3-deoxy-D-gluconate 5-dehydrogenase KduD [Mycoplasmopsis gallinacea]VEU58442.1 oxidoreductase [Mycoplasmopsis gallinacea]